MNDDLEGSHDRDVKVTARWQRITRRGDVTKLSPYGRQRHGALRRMSPQADVQLSVSMNCRFGGNLVTPINTALNLFFSKLEL